MRLALTHDTLLEPGNWNLFKKIRSSAFIPSLPIPLPIRTPASQSQVTPTPRDTRAIENLFIRWMRAALIVALAGLWSLALWVIVDALRLIFS
ncbi:MAG: hypothetical protein H7834_02430 [Magnetococcus sp. YQC-9]